MSQAEDNILPEWDGEGMSFPPRRPSIDPNETLRMLRQLVDPNWKHRDLITAEERADSITELFHALDEWLSDAGFLPEDWRKFADVRYDDGYRAGQAALWREINE